LIVVVINQVYTRGLHGIFLIVGNCFAFLMSYTVYTIRRPVLINADHGAG
jgi:hypothetical protein